MSDPIILGLSNTPEWETPISLNTENGSCSAASYRGVGYKNINEDRIVILPEGELFCVIDGMGGPGEGYKVADFLAEAVSKLVEITTQSIEKLLAKVSKKISLECSKPGAGACYLFAQVILPDLKIWYAGDVKLIIIDKNGEVKFETRDHSLLNSWIDSGELDPEDALNHPMRNVVTKAISAGVIEMEYCETWLSSDDRVVIASDGLWDNYTPNEVAGFIQNFKHSDAVQILLQKSTRKMETQTTDSWEGIQLPKPDNISILITDIISG